MVYNELTDLCGFVCVYLALISVRIALNKSHIQRAFRRCVCAGVYRDTVCDKMRRDTVHIETVDFQLLATNMFFLLEFFSIMCSCVTCRW